MAKSFHQYSPTAQLTVCAALSLGALGAAWRTVVKPAQIELAARRAHLAVVAAGVQKATAIAQRLPAVRNTIESLERATVKAAATLSDEKDAQGVLRGLNGLASESGLSISSFTPKPGAERDRHTEWPIELGLEGGYHDLARFFDRVASDPRLIAVSNLQFRASATARGPRSESVQATSVATTFQFPPPDSPIEAQPAAARVPPENWYDDGGRRDPFISLLAEKAPAAAVEPAEARARGLAGVAVMDVAVRGIVSSGQVWLAIVAGPDGAMYLAHANDRLHDGVVRRIDHEAVVFLTRVPDGPGRMIAREVRKALRPGTGDGR